MNNEAGCTCQICNKEYKVDLLIPDSIWEKIKPKGKPKGAGLLCGSCIMRRVEKLGKFDTFYTSADSTTNIDIPGYSVGLRRGF